MRPDMERSLYVMLCDAELRRLDPEREVERSAVYRCGDFRPSQVLEKRHQIKGPTDAIDRLCSMASAWQSENSPGQY